MQKVDKLDTVIGNGLLVIAILSAVCITVISL